MFKKNLLNKINPQIVYYDLDPDTLSGDLVSPPELHFLTGFVSLLDNFLLYTWQGFDDKLKSGNN